MVANPRFIATGAEKIWGPEPETIMLGNHPRGFACWSPRRRWFGRDCRLQSHIPHSSLLPVVTIAFGAPGIVRIVTNSPEDKIITDIVSPSAVVPSHRHFSSLGQNDLSISHKAFQREKKGMNTSRDRNAKGREEPDLLCDPGSELRLRGERKKGRRQSMS